MTASTPGWAAWQPSEPYSLGAEEEVMLLDPSDWSLAYEIDRVLEHLPAQLEARVTRETQGAVLELATAPHPDAAGVAAELLSMRRELAGHLADLELKPASAGTHPFTVWQETVVSSGARYQEVYGSMRELARREPTFALHIHVGVPDSAQGILLVNRLRAHLPLLLALSVNSPFWQGRDTGLASARTPLFQAFPRVGIPRLFRDYDDWVQTVDLLIRCDAFAEPTFLWWDVRPQPRFGTVEVRILDAQTTVGETAGLVGLVQSIARLELEDRYASDELVGAQEVLAENRFLAARDGMDARLIDPLQGCRVPARQQLEQLLEACAPHSAALGSERELETVERMLRRTGAERQVALALEPRRLPGLVCMLAEAFCDEAWDAGGAPRPAGESPPSDFVHLARGA